MRNFFASIAGAIVGLLVTITTRAAESALDAQDALAPSETPAQKQVAAARDHLLDSIAALATAQEHLNTEHAEAQAALAMHSSGATQAYMKIQGIQGFAAAIDNTKTVVTNLLSPPSEAPAPAAEQAPSTDAAPEATPTAAPEPAAEAAGPAANNMVSEGSPVTSEGEGH